MNDLYTIELTKTRRALEHLCSVQPGVVHTQAVTALLVSAPQGAIGQFKIEAFAGAPTDPTLAGALLCCGLVAFRQLYPEAFAHAMKRLAEQPHG